MAVVLAAGAGSRFAGSDHKLAARIGERTVLSLAVESAITAAIGPVLVVTGAVALLVIAKHRGNVERLLAGTQHRLGSKKR